MKPTKTIARMTSDIPPRKTRSLRRARGGAETLISMATAPTGLCSSRWRSTPRSCQRHRAAQGRDGARCSLLDRRVLQRERPDDPIQLRLDVGALRTPYGERDDVRLAE